jgi:hypothetical protein
MSRGPDARASLERWLAQVDQLVQEQPEPGAGRGGRIYATLTKERDLQLQIGTVWIADVEFVSVRDYVPSAQEYEVELLIERRLLPQLIGHLSRLDRHLGGSAHEGLGQ